MGKKCTAIDKKILASRRKGPPPYVGMGPRMVNPALPGPDYPLCRLYHMVGPPSQGGPRRSAAKFLPRCFDVWTFSVRLNVTTTKKGRQHFGGKQFTATDKKIPASRTRKGPPPYVGMGPRMVNPALRRTVVCPMRNGVSYEMCRADKISALWTIK